MFFYRFLSLFRLFFTMSCVVLLSLGCTSSAENDSTLPSTSLWHQAMIMAMKRAQQIDPDIVLETISAAPDIQTGQFLIRMIFLQKSGDEVCISFLEQSFRTEMVIQEKCGHRSKPDQEELARFFMLPSQIEISPREAARLACPTIKRALGSECDFNRYSIGLIYTPSTLKNDNSVAWNVFWQKSKDNTLIKSIRVNVNAVDGSVIESFIESQ
jgi:hypothetical protein